jgi:hypothetical protein
MTIPSIDKNRIKYFKPSLTRVPKTRNLTYFFGKFDPIFIKDLKSNQLIKKNKINWVKNRNLIKHSPSFEEISVEKIKKMSHKKFQNLFK